MRYAKEQLRALGYDVSDCLLHMTNKEHDDDDDDFAGNFKKHIRDSICKNYTVLCNAGDRWSDVLDENYDKKYDRSLYYAIKPPQDKIVFALKFPEMIKMKTMIAGRKEMQYSFGPHGDGMILLHTPQWADTCIFS